MRQARLQLKTNNDFFISDVFVLPEKNENRSFEHNCKAAEMFVKNKVKNFKIQHLRFILRSKEWHIECLFYTESINDVDFNLNKGGNYTGEEDPF